MTGPGRGAAVTGGATRPHGAAGGHAGTGAPAAGGHDHHHAAPAGHDGHGHHAGHGDHAARFRDRFWLSLALTVPLVASSPMVQSWLGLAPLHLPGAGWVAPLLGSAVFLYGGWPFLEGGLPRRAPASPA